MTLRDLHEAATSAPWRRVDGYPSGLTRGIEGAGHIGVVRFEGISRPSSADGQANAALIVALRNAYADGTLVERSKVDVLIAAADHYLTWGGAANAHSLRAAIEALEAPNA